LRCGERYLQSDILTRLAELQYTRNDIDFARGNFRVRGDIIDIFPAESERNAIRLDLFDDELETLSLFDPLTGEVLSKVPRFTIYPKSHYVTPRDNILKAADAIEEELRDRLEHLKTHDKLVEEQRLGQRTKYDLELIRELGFCTGIENYSSIYRAVKPASRHPPYLIICRMMV